MPCTRGLVITLVLLCLTGCGGAGLQPTESRPSVHNQPVLAVGEFSPLGATARTRPGLGTGIREVVRNGLASAPGLRLVSRDKSNQVLKEQQIRSSGFTRPEDAVQVGSLVGADFVVAGSYQLSYSEMYVNATMYNVKNGVSMAAASAVGPTDSLRQRYRLGRRLTRRLLEDFGIDRPSPSESENSPSLVLWIFTGLFMGAGVVLFAA